MGERSASDTLAQIFFALIERRTICQADFAREIEVEPRTLRRRLHDMQAAGTPLTRDEDHPNVYWSVPKGWLPGGIAVSSAEVIEVVRYLQRAQQSAIRDRLLERFLQRAGGGASLPSVDVVVSPTIDEDQDAILRVFEDALATRQVVAMKWFSRERGVVENREVSVHRLVFTDPARIVAVCHRNGALKWFRIDNVQRARAEASLPYRDAAEDAIDRFLHDTKFGFHQRGERKTHAFTVREPESRWVGAQLGSGVDAERTPGGTRFTLTTAATTPLARFVVSLGDAATVETPELAEAVAELARGALRGSTSPPRKPD